MTEPAKAEGSAAILRILNAQVARKNLGKAIPANAHKWREEQNIAIADQFNTISVSRAGVHCVASAGAVVGKCGALAYDMCAMFNRPVRFDFNGITFNIAEKF